VRKAAALLFAGLAFLGGCSSKPEPVGCPSAGIVGELSQLTRYRPGEGRDLSDVLYTLRVAEVGRACKVDRAGANVDLRVVFVAERGPAAAPNEAVDFEYFVAVANTADQVIAKELFRSRIDFGGRNRIAVAEEQTVQRVPVARQRESASSRIIVGLQLTPEELGEKRQSPSPR
jgi:hypothetical protein